ncbi:MULTISPECIES: hypothetical protein [Dyella]|uniref:Uncharacterized protein n=2 Tax=Dyella TaxID=231454 RepID=A0A4R0YUS9_9GAMM|nr:MULTISPECIES: hypothetical protein [Dyella]TBR39340.1 hypothetical protein EYV96_03705 [Dyella terrae]TCI13072.1 hypothetical protein EZM97_07160 [Dyella soli]
MIHSRSRTTARHDGGLWYRQPVVWLGMGIFVATLAGCVWMIVLGSRHRDEAVETSRQVFGVPKSAHSAPQPHP